MQQDLPSNEIMLFSVCIAAHAPYIHNNFKKYKMRNHFELVLSSINVYLKKLYLSQIRLDSFGF